MNEVRIRRKLQNYEKRWTGLCYMLSPDECEYIHDGEKYEYAITIISGNTLRSSYS